MKSDKKYCGDVNWSNEQSPMTKMIGAFLDSVGTKTSDPRLHPSLALATNAIIDEINELYEKYTVDFLNRNIFECIFNIFYII